MAATQIADQVKVIDCDTHVIEPYDLWTSRVSKKWGDLVPHVRKDPKRGDDRWWFGGKRSWAAAGFAMAGWKEYPPDHPPSIDEADRGVWDAPERVRTMDQYGIYAQVLFPNIGGFGSGSYLSLGEPALILECVRAYNDWQHEWTSATPERFIKVAAIPYWDMDQALQETDRCAKLGFRAVLFSSTPDSAGLPNIADPHWDPLFSRWQEIGWPVEFHIGSGAAPATGRPEFHHGYRPNGLRANYAKNTAAQFQSNSRAIADVIGSGLCHRYPRLNWISVESGVGWVPAFLEAMDWQWLGCGVPQEHPEYDLMPSEYFRRQIYSCFWFERDAAIPALLTYPDNCLYETDFPHPTSQSPGPASPAVSPREYIDDVLGRVPEDVQRKVLHGNAARIYHLED